MMSKVWILILFIFPVQNQSTPQMVQIGRFASENSCIAAKEKIQKETIEKVKLSVGLISNDSSVYDLRGTCIVGN